MSAWKGKISNGKYRLPSLIFQGQTVEIFKGNNFFEKFSSKAQSLLLGPLEVFLGWKFMEKIQISQQTITKSLFFRNGRQSRKSRVGNLVGCYGLRNPWGLFPFKRVLSLQGATNLNCFLVVFPSQQKTDTQCLQVILRVNEVKKHSLKKKAGPLCKCTFLMISLLTCPLL